MREIGLDIYVNYRDNRRITPIVGVADLGWSITTSSYFNQNPNNFNGGSHGYDNRFCKNKIILIPCRLPDMQAIFIAQGPAFKNGIEVQQISSLDIYNLMCKILSVNPAPNNGTLPVDILSFLYNK